jgi:long-chain acyl-CoA synthetase
LTGGNGFLGKVLLGLLLDRYPEFKHLHILLRSQRNLPATRRFSETLRSPALDQVVQKKGKDFLNTKVTVWEGDIAQSACGLDNSSLEELAGRIGLIINCAGRVDFFPPLDSCFSANVDGVEHLVALAKRLGAKLLHVSTCYVCGEADGLIEETEPILGFYPRRKGPDDGSFKHAEELSYCRERIRQIHQSRHSNYRAAAPENSKDVAQRLTTLGKQRAEYWGWVNTYTYAKSLGEQIIAAEPGLDYAIVRPAIIESALRFPFPGWIEGGRTAAPLVLMALGGMSEWPVRRDIPLEVVPVDLVASAILAIGALLINRQHRPVYQLGTADVNPVFLEDVVTLLDAESRKRREKNGNRSFVHLFAGARPSWRRVAAQFVSVQEARARRRRMHKRISHTEALISRMAKMLETAGLPGKDSLAVWATDLRKLGLQASFREQTLEQFLPFILHNRYVFESENIRLGYSLISQKDRGLLRWDPERIDWSDYWIDHQVKGIERWVQPEAVRDWAFKI